MIMEGETGRIGWEGTTRYECLMYAMPLVYTPSFVFTREREIYVHLPYLGMSNVGGLR